MSNHCALPNGSHRPGNSTAKQALNSMCCQDSAIRAAALHRAFCNCEHADCNVRLALGSARIGCNSSSNDQLSPQRPRRHAGCFPGHAADFLGKLDDVLPWLPAIGATRYGPCFLDSSFGARWTRGAGADVRIRLRLRPRLKGNAVFLTLLAAVVTVLLLIYLLTALLRPEWF